MRSLGCIYFIRAEKQCMVITTRKANGDLAIHNIEHHQWNQLLHSIEAKSDNDAIGRELIERLELMGGPEGQR